MAPELLDSASCQQVGYNPELSDIFSLGIILFSLYMGKPPFRVAHPSKDDLYALLHDDKQEEFWKLWDS